LAAKEKALRLIELKGVDLSPLQSEAIEKEIQGGSYIFASARV